MIYWISLSNIGMKKISIIYSCSWMNITSPDTKTSTSSILSNWYLQTKCIWAQKPFRGFEVIFQFWWLVSLPDWFPLKIRSAIKPLYLGGWGTLRGGVGWLVMTQGRLRTLSSTSSTVSSRSHGWTRSSLEQFWWSGSNIEVVKTRPKPL